jgi:hypothetical protein
MGFGLVEITAVEDYLGSKRLHRSYLERVGPFRYANQGTGAKNAASVGYRLAVVPGGSRNQPPLPFLWGQVRQQVNASSGFECSQGQVVIMLQVNLGLQHLAQSR